MNEELRGLVAKWRKSIAEMNRAGDYKSAVFASYYADGLAALLAKPEAAEAVAADDNEICHDCRLSLTGFCHRCAVEEDDDPSGESQPDRTQAPNEDET